VGYPLKYRGPLLKYSGSTGLYRLGYPILPTLLCAAFVCAVLLFISGSDPNSELERELAPFAKQARARAKARDTIINEESELSDMRSSNFEGIKEDVTLATIGVETGGRGSVGLETARLRPQHHQLCNCGLREQGWRQRGTRVKGSEYFQFLCGI
jgi:hypothetical protein